MLGGFIAGLIVAFILSLFSVDVMILEVVQPFVKTVVLTNSHYYILLGLIGLISAAFSR